MSPLKSLRPPIYILEGDVSIHKADSIDGA